MVRLLFDSRSVCLVAYNTLVLATQAIANVVKSSFGPSGLDKMMVDDIGVGLPRSPMLNNAMVGSSH
jgi:chaperonin GroEL (HSP60 family)